MLPIITRKFFLFFALLLAKQICLSQNNMATNSLARNTDQWTKFRVEFNLGLGRMVGKSAARNDFEREYEEKLRKGKNVEFSLSYFPNPTVGLGMKLESFSCRNSVSNVSVRFADGTSAVGEVSDRISVVFYGPNLVFRVPTMRNNENYFIFSFAFGVVNYVDNAVVIDPISMSGSTFGGCFNAGYDFSIGSNLSLGASASYWGGVLSRVDVTQNGLTKHVDLIPEEQVTLSRITGVIGLKYNL